MFKEELITLIGTISKGKQEIPGVVALILTSVVPRMMGVVGKVNVLDGEDKKRMIIDAVECAIMDGFAELNKLPDFEKANWDEILRDFLLKSMPLLIDTLISVENGSISFNNPKSCFSKIFCC